MFLSTVVEICVEEVIIDHLTDLISGVHLVAREGKREINRKLVRMATKETSLLLSKLRDVNEAGRTRRLAKLKDYGTRQGLLSAGSNMDND